MKQIFRGKTRLLLTVAVCVLFVAVAFSCAAREPLNGSKFVEEHDDPVTRSSDSTPRPFRALRLPEWFYKIFNYDWNYWTNPPHMYAIPDGNVGIGTSSPDAKLHVKNVINSVGTLYELPSISNLPDPAYTHDAVMQWQGGETKFGKWRQYFNGYEQSWALTYNAPWNYTDNSWEGRDSGDSRANIGAYMRFNVAEGDSGRNTFEVNFARGGNAGTVPDWNDGAYYFFYDGSTTKAVPAELVIRGAANMDSILKLVAHETVDPLRINLKSDGVNKKFNIERVDSISWTPSYTETVTEILTIKTDTGNVGIGTTSPENKLHVNGAINLDPITEPANPSTGFVIYVDSADGNLKAKASTGTITVLANP